MCIAIDQSFSFDLTSATGMMTGSMVPIAVTRIDSPSLDQLLFQMTVVGQSSLSIYSAYHPFIAGGYDKLKLALESSS